MNPSKLTKFKLNPILGRKQHFRSSGFLYFWPFSLAIWSVFRPSRSSLNLVPKKWDLVLIQKTGNTGSESHNNLTTSCNLMIAVCLWTNSWLCKVINSWINSESQKMLYKCVSSSNSCTASLVCLSVCAALAHKNFYPLRTLQNRGTCSRVLETGCKPVLLLLIKIENRWDRLKKL